MDTYLPGVPVIIGSILLAHVLLTIVDALYLRHSDLLIRHWQFTEITIKRQLLIGGGVLGVGGLLSIKYTEPLLFAINLLLALFIIIIIVTDYEQQLIFDRILVGLAVLTLVFSPVIEATVVSRAMAAVAGGSVMLLLAMLPGAIGGGDIKLLFVLGLWQGLEHLLEIFVIGICGGGFAALLLLVRGSGRRDLFAYGPYFAMAALIALMR